MGNTMKAGERLYYTGDMANESDIGTIQAVKHNEWGTVYVVKFDGMACVQFVNASVVGPYSGHCSPRFSPLADVERFRAERMAALLAVR